MWLLLLLLLSKHFVLDFIYQPPFQWKNKGTYGHIGGILHAGQHALASFAILLCFLSPGLALVASSLEFVVHYHMDWFKMWYNKRKGWGANTHSQFWVLMGLDQYIHGLTYLGLALFL